MKINWSTTAPPGAEVEESYSIQKHSHRPMDLLYYILQYKITLRRLPLSSVKSTGLKLLRKIDDRKAVKNKVVDTAFAVKCAAGGFDKDSKQGKELWQPIWNARRRMEEISSEAYARLAEPELEPLETIPELISLYYKTVDDCDWSIKDESV